MFFIILLSFIVRNKRNGSVYNLKLSFYQLLNAFRKYVSRKLKEVIYKTILKPVVMYSSGDMGKV